MNIQAISPAIACQPIKQVEFAGKRSASDIYEAPGNSGDIFALQDPRTVEQKYDFACRLAAYYKTQYENLLKNGSCEG